MNHNFNLVKQFMESKNPQQMIKNYIGNNPLLNNLVNMAQKGDKESVETFARNLYKENGKDFDKEFAEFMNNFK